jgi:transcriptional regulator of arginine metabolism
MSAATKHDRQRAIRELVARGSAGSQLELAAALRSRGFPVTQATVSRDITELGLVKVARGDRHVYLAPEDLAPPAAQAAGSDGRLRRILADIPVRTGRSGLTLLLIGSPGSASVLGQAIDESSLDEQEGTLAGDNTLLVLFANEARLERWLDRFRTLQGMPDPGSPFPTHAITEAPR